MGRAIDLLDADQRVAFGGAAEAASVLEVDADAHARVAVIRRVQTLHAIEQVGAAAADEAVIAAVADKRLVPSFPISRSL